MLYRKTIIGKLDAISQKAAKSIAPLGLNLFTTAESAIIFAALNYKYVQQQD